jgi:hypothetical protein
VKRLRLSGLSLAEVMVTLLLVGLVIIVLSDLTLRVGAANTQSRQHAESLELIQHGLEQIRTDFLSAFQVINPSGLNATTIDLQSMKFADTVPQLPPATGRLIKPVNFGVPPSWNPLDPAHTIRVLYDVSGGELRRTVGTAAPKILTKVEDFKASRVRSNFYEVRIKVLEKTRPVELKAVVYKP